MRSHAPGILSGTALQSPWRLSCPGAVKASRPSETANEQRLLAESGGAQFQLCSRHDSAGIQESDDGHIGGGCLLQFAHSAGNASGEGQPGAGAAVAGGVVRHEDWK